MTLPRRRFLKIAAATLGDVMEQAGQQQQLGTAQARPDFVRDREPLVDAAREPVHVRQHRQRVLVGEPEGFEVPMLPDERPRDGERQRT